MKTSALVVLAITTLAARAPATAPAPPPVPEGASPLPAAAHVTGLVTDAASGNPLSGARITLPGAARAGALSDVDGRYRILVPATVPVGTEVEVRAALIGYAEATATIVLAEGGNRVDFALTASAVELRGVAVAASRTAEQARVAAFRRERDVLQSAMAPAWPTADPGDPRFNTESYAHLPENPFLSVAASPLSTFSIDVDRASYANVRRFINQGQAPPVDAVRIEELVNYFTYDYPEPGRGGDPFSVHTEVARAPWTPAHLLVKIGLQGRRVHLEDLPPSNLVFLIDVSGSMTPANKLPLLKKAFRMLVNELRPEDRVAIVVYAGAAGLVLPSTPGSDKRAILDAIERLEAGGSTAGGAGIRLAYRVARDNHVAGGNNRVILATDGDFNIGPSSDSEMVRLIEEKREQGTFLTVLGFGTGNLKDSRMEQLADHGNGNFAYIDGELEARKVLVEEMGGTLLTIAKDVKLQVEFNPTRVRAYRLIGYENRRLADADFDDDTRDAGELGAGHSVTALYEVIPVGVESETTVRQVAPLRYGTEDVTSRATDSDELLFVKLRYKEPDGAESRLLTHVVPDRVTGASADLRFAAAVAAFGMVLRESEHCGTWGLADVAELAMSGVGRDEAGYRADFLGLVETASRLELIATRER